jgi:phosphoserine aminotransferase
VPSQNGLLPDLPQRQSVTLFLVSYSTPSADSTGIPPAYAKKAGMVGLKGYRDLGGIRVSMYNAVTVDNVRTLVGFMDEFARKHA